MKRVGLDVGSTTIKCVVTDENDNIIFKSYERHLAQIAEKTAALLRSIRQRTGEDRVLLCMSGSAGMGTAEAYSIPFIQEVYATRLAVKKYIPDADVVIELGGEDAKILFLGGGLEVRMNGSCAGGTGAFIDQMASLLKVEPNEMDTLAANKKKIYTIASRCGVFAKSDIQPLLNQGAAREDIAASIFLAVVNQTIGGLAQGRKIQGNVVYLGGPLTFFPQLRYTFDQVLGTTGIFPENSLYFVSLGASMSAVSEEVSLSDLISRLENGHLSGGYASLPPLFRDKAEYEAFALRHRGNSDHIKYISSPGRKTYLGVDAGSTTIKAAVIDENGAILRTMYRSSSGNAVDVIKEFLTGLYAEFPGIKIDSAAVTGYGEELLKNAFNLDFGVVETIAHYKAARRFMPDVDFIIDIGGQDIKCFKIQNGTIGNIFLNEACSSGCGSFFQTFAGALGYDAKEFAKLGLSAQHPVDLGSRCTVFMNSSVKQAQKDGATLEDISAGLSISVVKNAIYKVIRAASPEELGRHIVVQGGTFRNDAVLRAFEQELGVEVVRPEIAEVMGAYGAALYAKEHDTGSGSGIVSAEELKNFTYKTSSVNCSGCSNHCRLTITSFPGSRRFIGGNRCSKPTGEKQTGEKLDLYAYKLSLLDEVRSHRIVPRRGTIGIPMCLNMYELLPFWCSIFQTLGFDTIVSPQSDRGIFTLGQGTIPSDTICYPAKLVHGHMEYLIAQKPDAVFYPCLSYNLDEGLGDNHFNCPVVAYYPQVIKANMDDIKSVPFICDSFGLHNPDTFKTQLYNCLTENFGRFSKKEVAAAAENGYRAREEYLSKVRAKGREYIAKAKAAGRRIIVLCGRPYHADPEINHGISELICSLGAAVVTEDSVSQNEERFKTGVLNQWTYHSRIYAAAKYIADSGDEDINLVQLVSFGCGLDAITTDETRSILEAKGRIYTQIKIDEIANLGTVKIRLRSLFDALSEGKEAAGK